MDCINLQLPQATLHGMQAANLERPLQPPTVKFFHIGTFFEDIWEPSLQVPEISSLLLPTISLCVILVRLHNGQLNSENAYLWSLHSGQFLIYCYRPLVVQVYLCTHLWAHDA